MLRSPGPTHVVGEGGDHADDEPPVAAHLHVAQARVCVLPQHARVLLMQAHSLGDHHALTLQ
jgi:hypothetical protein